jgi:phage terminase small subunit
MAPSRAPRPLTPRERRFVDEYLVDLNATRAAIAAGYAPKNAKVTGCRLLQKELVATAIAAAAKAREQRTQISADRVLEELVTIATGYVGELIEYRRRCCRHCYGEGHRYQRTRLELENDRVAHEQLQRREEARAAATPGAPAFVATPFDEKGGAGWDPRRDPFPECPVCFGDGIADAYIHDTRRASPIAKRLYAGVKLTKDGLEVKLRDQDGALAMLAKHFKLIPDRHEHTGAGGAPIAHTVSALTVRFVRPGEPDGDGRSS